MIDLVTKAGIMDFDTEEDRGSKRGRSALSLGSGGSVPRSAPKARATKTVATAGRPSVPTFYGGSAPPPSAGVQRPAVAL